MDKRIPVAVLGATGMVGQRFVQRLAQHEHFRLAYLAASARSAGKSYAESCVWRIGGEPYGGFGAQRVLLAEPGECPAPLVFSALDAGPAREIEARFAEAGAVVFSNASAFRMEPDVPLLIPEVNPEHLELLSNQRTQRDWSGAILCNPNCTTTVLAMGLAPLHQAFGVEEVSVVSMQAVSGAGYPGVASLDVLGNVVPHLPGEEEKVESEAAKLLGKWSPAGIRVAEFTVSAACHRLPVIDGHTLAVSVRLRGAPSPQEVAQTMEQWNPLPQQLGLASAPPRALRIHTASDRPQVRHDVEADGGMSVHVGRVRECPILGIKFLLLGHNTERGAAGGSILNAELAHAKRWFDADGLSAGLSIGKSAGLLPSSDAGGLV